MMNTLHKFLTIAFLAVSILISGLTVNFAGAQDTAAGMTETRRSANPLTSRYLRFARLTTKDGLSNDQLRGIVQDSHGFIWMATHEGLNRYDGSSVKVYRHDPDNPLSLSNNMVTAIHEDRNGSFWIGTEYGLNRLDGDTFTRFIHDPKNLQSLSSNLVMKIYEDRSGELWIGTGNGINKLVSEYETFIRYQHDPKNPQSLGSNTVLSIHEDQTGSIWVATWGGLIDLIVRMIDLPTIRGRMACQVIL